MKIIYTNACNKDFINLCIMLDNNLNEIVGGEKQREEYIQYNTLEDIHDVILIYENNEPIGCGSFKHYNDKTAEIKRVYVVNDFRGKGISKVIMNNLEKKAKDKGYKRLILETGTPLVEAKSLYKRMGYEVIENFGQYKCMKDSICMQKMF
ncbi:MAG: GNAT family N-acetyltransferase [Clostridiales bacterium]